MCCLLCALLCTYTPVCTYTRDAAAGAESPQLSGSPCFVFPQDEIREFCLSALPSLKIFNTKPLQPKGPSKLKQLLARLEGPSGAPGGKVVQDGGKPRESGDGKKQRHGSAATSEEGSRHSKQRRTDTRETTETVETVEGAGSCLKKCKAAPPESRVAAERDTAEGETAQRGKRGGKQRITKMRESLKAGYTHKQSLDKDCLRPQAAAESLETSKLTKETKKQKQQQQTQPQQQKKQGQQRTSGAAPAGDGGDIPQGTQQQWQPTEEVASPAECSAGRGSKKKKQKLQQEAEGSPAGGSSSLFSESDFAEQMQRLSAKKAESLWGTGANSSAWD